MSKLKPKQVRQVELRDLAANTDNDSMKLSGHAAVYDSPTVLWEYNGVKYKEVIARGAFDNTDMKDCCLKYNHSNDIPILARYRGGSLILSLDDIGLKWDANLFDTSVARDVYALVKGGGLDKCSFAFTVEEEEYDSSTHTRTIKKIGKLFDVSIVDIPAYDDTDVSARDYFKSEDEKYKTLERENQRKRAILKLSL